MPARAHRAVRNRLGRQHGSFYGAQVETSGFGRPTRTATPTPDFAKFARLSVASYLRDFCRSLIGTGPASCDPEQRFERSAPLRPYVARGPEKKGLIRLILRRIVNL